MLQGVSRSSTSGDSHFPPLQEHTLQNYVRIFGQLDKTGDGKVQVRHMSCDWRMIFLMLHIIHVEERESSEGKYNI
jgi:hypothetical protein